MAIEEQVLREISENVQRVGNSSESFRTTANRQNSNIQKIVKDISEMFKSQSVAAGELSSSIDGLQNQMAQTTDKTDAVASSLERTINVQNSMLGELKGIGQGIDNLSNMIMMLMQNNNSSFGGGGGGGGVATSLLKALAGTAGLGVGAGALASIFGANYTQNDSTNSTNNNNQTGTQSQQGVTTEIDSLVAAIKKRESGGEAAFGRDPYKAVARGPDGKPLEGATASGAYQFIDSTWKDAAAMAGVSTEQYPRALNAPPEVQDRVAKQYINYLREEKAKGDASLVPVLFKAGANTDLNNISPTNRAYQQDVMSNVQSQQTAQQPTANSSPGTSNDYAKFLMDRAQGGVNAEKLNPSFAAKLTKAIQEAEQVTGEKIQITSGFRSAEQQAQLYANYIGKAYSITEGCKICNDEKIKLEEDVNNDNYDSMVFLWNFERFDASVKNKSHIIHIISF